MKTLKQILIYTAIILGFLLPVSCNKDGSSSSGFGDSNVGSGQGGSLARFTIAKGFLYVVDHNMLHTFNISDPGQPQRVSSLNIGFNIETIYAFQDRLFVGSQDAMYVYSIASPASPKLVGTASHVRACDPVVANENTAYVTVRSGTNCGGQINALMVYKINNGNYTNPTFMKQVNLSNPRGLGIKQNTLFVCDGNQGLVVFDITDNLSPTQQMVIKDAEYFDCIPYGNHLYCMIKGGTAIYDISNVNDIKLLAKITD